MTKRAKRLDAIRNNPRDVSFDNLVGLVRDLGFKLVRQNASSHAIFQHPLYPMNLINLQSTKNGKTKPYQVEQVLAVMDRCNLEVT